MTIIIAQKTTTGVLMGADNTMTAGSILVRRATPKLVSLGPRVVVELAGLVRLNDIVRHDVMSTIPQYPPKKHEPGSAFPYPADAKVGDGYDRALGEYFRALMKDEPADVSFYALVACDREIFRCGPKGGVTRVLSAYDAIGIADTVALGSLYALSKDKHLPTIAPTYAMVTTSLEACAEHIECIRPPWVFAETRAPDA